MFADPRAPVRQRLSRTIDGRQRRSVRDVRAKHRQQSGGWYVAILIGMVSEVAGRFEPSQKRFDIGRALACSADGYGFERSWLTDTTDLLTKIQICCVMQRVTSTELKRWLEKQGCTFEAGRGSHLIVRRGASMSVLPMHGKGKDLGTGLVNAIKKQLGLK